jgi:hypothetical protein
VLGSDLHQAEIRVSQGAAPKEVAQAFKINDDYGLGRLKRVADMAVGGLEPRAELEVMQKALAYLQTGTVEDAKKTFSIGKHPHDDLMLLFAKQATQAP